MRKMSGPLCQKLNEINKTNWKEAARSNSVKSS